MSIRRLLSTSLVALFWAVPVRGDVTTSEFHSDPPAEGWVLAGQDGDATSWVADSVFFQNLPHLCPSGSFCDNQVFTRSIQQYNGHARWFYEYRVSATSDHTEIPGTAPTVLSAFNAFGELYHATLASDRIQLFRDADLPVLFFDLTPEPHTIRLELFNDPPPAAYRWYIDSVLVDEGLAEDVFPSADSRITWQGQTWMQPTVNSWWYIRAGDLPEDGSFDFNGDGLVSSFDHFYFSECVDRGASGEPAFPSCEWANDLTQPDNVVDCADWQAFKAAWTGPGDPPPIPGCPEAIPAASLWGVTVMMLLTCITATVVFRRLHLL